VRRRTAAPAACLAAAFEVDEVRVGNRFCILPMEGWDGHDGLPSDFTPTALKSFRIGGAKLIWGRSRRRPSRWTREPESAG
jgi:hypothetical protein